MYGEDIDWCKYSFAKPAEVVLLSMAESIPMGSEFFEGAAAIYIELQKANYHTGKSITGRSSQISYMFHYVPLDHGMRWRTFAIVQFRQKRPKPLTKRSEPGLRGVVLGSDSEVTLCTMMKRRIMFLRHGGL